MLSEHRNVLKYLRAIPVTKNMPSNVIVYPTPSILRVSIILGENFRLEPIFSLKRSHKRFIKGLYNMGTNMYLIEAHYEQCCRIIHDECESRNKIASLSFPPKTCECTFCTKRTKDEVQIKNPSFVIHLNRQLCLSLPQNSFPFRDNEERSLLMSTWTNAAF